MLIKVLVTIKQIKKKGLDLSDDVLLLLFLLFVVVFFLIMNSFINPLFKTKSVIETSLISHCECYT